MFRKYFGLMVALGMFTLTPDIQGVAAQSESSSKCCSDPWGTKALRNDKWYPGNMKPGRRQRMWRHWRFLNQGVPPEYRGARNPVDNTPDNITAGGKIYTDTCASCHGKTGRGDGEAGRDLTPSPAILTHMIRMPMTVDEYLLWAISEGGVEFGTDMPAFKDVLSDRKIWQVIAYMRAGFPSIAAGD